MSEHEDLVGLTFDRARVIAECRGMRMRATMIDGKSMMVTQDMRTDRINVSVDDGIVTRLIKIG